MSVPPRSSRPERLAGTAEVLLVLERERDLIVGMAAETIGHGRTHYDSAGRDETGRRLDTLYDELLQAVSSRDLSSIIRYARLLAAKRFGAGTTSRRSRARSTRWKRRPGPASVRGCGRIGWAWRSVS